jgi:hypothetical protein
MSCPLKNLFGAPRTGVHAARIPVLDVALFDVLGTIAGAWAIQRYVTPGQSFWVVLIALFITGELMHRLFCVRD